MVLVSIYFSQIGFLQKEFDGFVNIRFLKLMGTSETVQPKVKWTIMVVLVLFIVNTLWMNGVFRHQLFVMSLSFIIDYQNHGNNFASVVYNIFSFISGTEFTFAILVMLILFTFRKANTFVLIWYVALNTYIMSVGKMAFADPRPTWYTDKVHQLQWKCEYTYGFPSGHCWIILILHWAVVCDMIGTGPYHINLGEPLIFGIFVPLSRFYLGSHSGDHVFSSITYGFAFALLYKFHFQKVVFGLFSTLLNGKNKRSYLAIIVILQILMMVPPIIEYQNNTRKNRLGDYFLYRLNTICNENYTLKQIQGRTGAESAIGNAVMGIMYALLLLRKDSFIHKNKRLEVLDYLLGKWNFGERKISHFILVMLLYIIPGGLILGIFFGLIPKLVDNFYADYYSMAFAWTSLTIYWFRYVPQIAFKIGWIEPQQLRKADNDFGLDQIH